jgi:hypothetical protein
VLGIREPDEASSGLGLGLCIALGAAFLQMPVEGLDPVFRSCDSCHAMGTVALNMATGRNIVWYSASIMSADNPA